MNHYDTAEAIVELMTPAERDAMLLRLVRATGQRDDEIQSLQSQLERAEFKIAELQNDAALDRLRAKLMGDSDD